jgi:hypothetical protein
LQQDGIALIDYFQNFLNEKELGDLFKFVDRISWKQIGIDIPDNKATTSHFSHTFIQSKKGIQPKEKILKIILKKIQDHYQASYLPHQLYINYYRFGDEFRTHADVLTGDQDNKTFMLYCTKKWSVNWYGQTLFYSPDHLNVIGGSVPYPNTAVCFDSHIPHSAVPISRFCNEKRIILIYQMEKRTGGKS